MGENPFGDDYDDLLGGVDTTPDMDDWETNHRVTPSPYFLMVGSTGKVVPRDFSTDKNEYGEGLIPWTKNDIPGDIVLRPEILENPMTPQEILKEQSIAQDELKVPVRFSSYDEDSDPYIGFMKTGEIEEEVEVRTSQAGLGNLSIGKEYGVNILPETYVNSA